MEIAGYLHILMFFMIITAIITVETSNLLSAIVSMGALGFMLSIGFLLLGAPDIAITQIVVEIIVLIILIRATINRDLTAISGDRELVGLVISVAMIFVLSIIALRVVAQIPAFGSSVLDRIADAPSRTYLAEGLQKTGSANAVESIMMDYRLYDTLGALTALFCGILGAVALLRRKARKDPDKQGSEDAEPYELRGPKAGMSLIAKTVARWIKGFLVLFGIYLILNAHQSPGGGISGGVIIACALILVVLTEGLYKDARAKFVASLVASVGALLILGVLVFEQTPAGTIFKSFIARQDLAHPGMFAFSTIQISEIGIGLMVSAALYLVFSMLSALHIRVRDGKREMIRRKRG